MSWEIYLLSNLDVLFSLVLTAAVLFYSLWVRFNVKKDDPEAEEKSDAVARYNAGRRIIVAANLYSNGIVLVGLRHWDTLMQTQALCFRAQGLLPSDHEPQQGFLDNKGIFLTREQAWLVAENAGQIVRRVGGDGKELFTENLY